MSHEESFGGKSQIELEQQHEELKLISNMISLYIICGPKPSIKKSETGRAFSLPCLAFSLCC